MSAPHRSPKAQERARRDRERMEKATSDWDDLFKENREPTSNTPWMLPLFIGGGLIAVALAVTLALVRG